MTVDLRRLAVAINGFCTFLNLYSPQALLPELSHEFGASAAQISTIMTASTLAVALTAPVTGAIADVMGRKRVIVIALFAVSVPTIMVIFAATVPGFAAWRFVQGLFLPAIFAVTVAYIGDEWPPTEVSGVAGVYVTGASLGGFAGRMIPGALADWVGWRSAFVLLAAATFAAAILIIFILPREKRFVRSRGFADSGAQMLRHLRNPQLVATYAVGFGTLFNFIATFTYISFHLAAPPYDFSATLLGGLFFTYLGGTAIAPWTGRFIAGFGRRNFVLGLIAIWIAGAALLLAPQLGVILAGLLVCATCGMLCQSVSTGYITLIAREGRSSAVGLYVTCFYAGGSMGAFLPGLTWASAGWPAAVAMLIAMQVIMGAVVWFAWARTELRTGSGRPI
ncbi:MAG TPA: MFS transporter [Xanthobacteraceae bacterium]|nr:MFS transporter [Xanthobacteraceae bacterium]